MSSTDIPRNDVSNGSAGSTPWHIKKVRKHLTTGAGFVLGAVVSTMIGRVLENQLNRDAAEAAKIQQEQISNGAALVHDGVRNLEAALENLRKDTNPADLAAFQAFQRHTDALLSDLNGAVPVIEKAALNNADTVARIRAAALSRPDGASTTAAFELPVNGAATICRDFTVGVRTTGPQQANPILGRRGESNIQNNACSGETTGLRQADASASATIAGFGRGANGDMIGIDFNCFQSTG